MTAAAPLTVHDLGDPRGAPILAVHGITGFGLRFTRLATEGLPERRWVAPDLRGHGGSSADPPWGTEQHVADLVAVLDAAGVDRADVVGHSFGGHLALHLLAAAPERVGRVALLDPASAVPPQAAGGLAANHLADQSWASPADAEAAIRPWFGDDPTDLPREIEHNLAAGEDGRWRLRFSRATVIAACGEVARPLPPLPPGGRDVLLVEADPAQTTVSDTLRDGLARSFGSGLHRVVVPGASHVVYRTAFGPTVGALAPFLEGAGR